jgi:hypothetical protein
MLAKYGPVSPPSACSPWTKPYVGVDLGAFDHLAGDSRAAFEERRAPACPIPSEEYAFSSCEMVIRVWARLNRAQQLVIASVEPELKADELPRLLLYDVLLEVESGVRLGRRTKRIHFAPQSGRGSWGRSHYGAAFAAASAQQRG